MLPSIKNTGEPLKMYQFRASEDLAPPSSHSQSRMPHKFSVTHSSETRNKPSLLFKKSSSFKQEEQNNFMATATAVSNPIRYPVPATAMYRSNLSDEIRQIERKIRRCQRKIREDRLKEIEERETVDSGKDIEFVDMNRFDFLTNPGGGKNDEPIEQVKQAEEPQRNLSPKDNPDFINENIQKLGIHYAKDLKRKFERRQLMPHKAVKRKVPKLYITQQTNALQKIGKPLSQQEHLFRVMTKEVTPQEIYPTIPSFPVVRDNISKNVLAYLADYKPFIDKTKEALPLVNKDEQESQLNVSGKKEQAQLV